MTYQDVINQIKGIFRGVEVVNFNDMEQYLYKNYFRNILVNIFNPPAYVVKIVMISVLNLKYIRGNGSVSWYAYFKFRNSYFRIRDYKFGSWTLEGLIDEYDIIRNHINKDSEIFKAALIIQKKIRRASKIFNKYFMDYVLSNIKSNKINDYYLKSSFNKLLNIYNFFKGELDDSSHEFETFKKRGENRVKIEETNGEEIEIEVMGKEKVIKPMKLFLNIEGFTHYEKLISNYTFALMATFYSLLEFILDSFYLFSAKKVSFLDFKKQSWYEKYKIIFPINKNKTFKIIYDKLTQIKKKYRNPLIHGLTGDSSLLVPIPNSGLVPISYEYLTDNVAYVFNEISYEDSKEIKDVFETFLELLRNEESFKFYILFLEFEFPIPLNEKEIKEIKNKMTTYEEFKQELID